MRDLSQAQLKRVSAVHGWSGVVLGLLLYAVVTTGTVIVFRYEIAAWSAGGIRAHGVLSGGIDAMARPILDGMSKGYQQRVNIFVDERGHLMLFPNARVRNPETGKTDSYGSLFKLDPATGETLSRHEGFAFRQSEWRKSSALEDFLYHLHERLHAPDPWGLMLTGVLGLLSMVAGLTGLVMHRHLIRDIFIAERGERRLVSARDRHVLAGTWALPFAFLLGFTGAYMSLFSPVVFPLLTEVAFAGDRDKMMKTLFEPQVATDPRPVRFTDMDAVIADSERRAGAPVNFIFIDNYGRRDSRIRLFHHVPSGGLNTVRTVYDGATGGFVGFRAPVGRDPSVAGTLFGLMAPLHFGNFAGALSKSVWVGLGTAMAFVVISGLRLWVRRRADEVLWRRFGRAVTIVGYGLPVAMLSCSYAYFFALAAGADAFRWTPAGFLIGIVPGVLPGLVARDEDALRRFYRTLLGVGVFLLPVVRMATGGLDWAAAIADGQGTVLSVDVTLLVLGAGLIRWARRPRAVQGPVSAAAE